MRLITAICCVSWASATAGFQTGQIHGNGAQIYMKSFHGWRATPTLASLKWRLLKTNNSHISNKWRSCKRFSYMYGHTHHHLKIHGNVLTRISLVSFDFPDPSWRTKSTGNFSCFHISNYYIPLWRWRAIDSIFLVYHLFLSLFYFQQYAYPMFSASGKKEFFLLSTGPTVHVTKCAAR